MKLSDKLRLLRSRIKRRLFCDTLNFHVGYPERIGGWMLFYCTRCDSHAHPIPPERADEITAKLREEHEERAKDGEYRVDYDNL